MSAKKLHHGLYFQVLVAILLGVAVGHFMPEFGAKLKPLGDGFIKLVKMMIAPIIFCTIVVGIASMEDMKKVGRVGGKALLYFEVVTSLALAIGLVVVNVLKPGAGMNVNPATLDAGAIAKYTSTAAHQSTVDFIMHMIPDSVVGAFAEGEILQVLLFSVLFGAGLSLMGESGKPVLALFEKISHVLFKVIGFIMKLAPIGAFGAMAFTIGKYGVGSLTQLAALMGSFYVTCVLFIALVLGSIARACGFNVWKLIKYIREELLIVLGTSSSESALPRLMSKLEQLGCAKPVVGLVIPTGYSFNLDGTSIYLTMAAIFIAQACNIDLSLTQELTIIGVLLLTSKGAAGVTGSGFITLAATLAVVPQIPVAGLALILGIDRFMSEARALTNLIGNAVATVVVAKWENSLDIDQLHNELANPTPLSDSPSHQYH
ncbi:dicarboxylate/amino acid:cation symporter [Vogesella sp. LIG4]|uniref:dicarboxylate/amino acid:cation symporter n=1 Tax=Vogesella sp. LIG4 TaxID=1192162 RepID=UPI00081FBFC6|nr:dicarboxylate/amino acid:cation symporter [Vogesella sp. LIG4]SCK09655.1 aerobic C4-dicarboxylate transport protein [Vogesella sp. LIG4]